MEMEEMEETEELEESEEVEEVSLVSEESEIDSGSLEELSGSVALSVCQGSEHPTTCDTTSRQPSSFPI